MQGFLISARKAREEHLIVRILTEGAVLTLFRFYGARHSLMTIGYHLDFEVESEGGAFLPRLRSPFHLPRRWQQEGGRLLYFQEFCLLLERHLRGVERVDPFYYELMERLMRTLESQDPRRALLEGYAALLAHEGRTPSLSRCFLCGQELGEEVSPARALMAGHTGCIYGETLQRESLRLLLEEGDALLLEDAQIKALHRLLSGGF